MTDRFTLYFLSFPLQIPSLQSALCLLAVLLSPGNIRKTATKYSACTSTTWSLIVWRRACVATASRYRETRPSKVRFGAQKRTANTIQNIEGKTYEFSTGPKCGFLVRNVGAQSSGTFKQDPNIVARGSWVARYPNLVVFCMSYHRDCHIHPFLTADSPSTSRLI